MGTPYGRTLRLLAGERRSHRTAWPARSTALPLGMMNETAITLRQHDLDALTARGLLHPRQRLAGRQLSRADAVWQRLAGQILITFAIGHLLAATLFFFAFNWAAMSGSAKLTVIGSALAISLAGHAIWPRPALIGQIMGISATVLIGVLFAVIGQIYQTGADAWQLFALWALLSAPLALMARQAVHLALWLIIANTAWLTFAAQYAVPLGWLTAETSIALAGLALWGLLLARDLMIQRFEQAWLAPVWTRLYLTVAAIGHLGFISVQATLNDDPLTLGTSLGLVGFWAGCLIIARVDGRTRTGFANASIAAAAITFMTGTALMRLLLEVSDGSEHLVLVLGTLGCVALLALFAGWLRRRLRSFSTAVADP